MRRLTTPTHTFKLPFDTSELEKIKITYAQNDEVILEKYKDDCKCEGMKMRLTLSQEDTKKFDDNYDVQIQIRFKHTAGVFSSKVFKRSCGECLDDEVL